MVSIKFMVAGAATFVATTSAQPLFKRADYVSASATRAGLARGTCWWRFAKSNVIDQAHCAVEDLGSNSHSVFAEIRYWDPVGQDLPLAQWHNKKGAGTGMSYDTTFHTTGTLRFATLNAYVRVCDNGPVDLCSKSQKIGNNAG